MAHRFRGKETPDCGPSAAARGIRTRPAGCGPLAVYAFLALSPFKQRARTRLRADTAGLQRLIIS
eukprot:6194660-Pleurochrysis_carterae.AAC.1